MSSDITQLRENLKGILTISVAIPLVSIVIQLLVIKST